MRQRLHAYRTFAASLSRSTLTILLGVAIAITFAWVYAYLTIDSEREKAFADEITRNSNLAKAHEERVIRVLQLFDQTLRVLRDDYSRNGKPRNIEDILTAIGVDRDAVGIVSLIGADGTVIATTARGMQINFADREYFKAHAADPTDKLIIGKPIQGRLTQKSIVALTRRLFRADGSFGGVVFMAVNPEAFARDYRDVELGPHSALALVGVDGITRVRRNNGKISVGENILSSQLFKELPKSSFGHFIGVAASDGVHRTASYRLLPEYPLIVVVASSFDDVEATLVPLTRSHIFSAALITALVIAAGILFGKLEARRVHEESTVRELNATLEKRVAQRTAEIEAFMYSVSHDFRAPLRAIDANAAMLDEELSLAEKGDPRKYIGRIRKGAMRMADLLNDLLDLSRFSTRELVKEKLDMSSKVKSIFEEMVVGKNAVKLEIGDLPDAFGDRILIRQVWINLIGNALKYSAKQSSPVISIGYANGEYFVRDNGVGFDEAYGNKLFKLFSRLHSDPDFEGTGVGLAVAKRIIERHGGHIQAHGSLGKGATFSFSLPD